MADEEVRDRIARASVAALDPNHVDPYVISLAHLAEAARETLLAAAAFEAARPTESEMHSGVYRPGVDERHERTVSADWRLGYLVGLRRSPELYTPLRSARPLCAMAAAREPAEGWQQRVLDALPPPQPQRSWIHRAWGWLVHGDPW